MEITDTPTSPLDIYVEPVQHPAHREYLYKQLGSLVELPIDVETSDDDQETEHAESDLITRQSHLIADYFAKASENLGSEATEDQIWDRVFTEQYWNLMDNKHTGNKEDIVLNILIGNIFSTYGLDESTAEARLSDRMWDIASTRRGLDVMAVANANVGLCVATGNSEKPFVSVREQVAEHGGLFMATDRSIDFKTSTLPVYELQNTDPKNQAWFIGAMGANKNFASLERNLEFISDKRALCEALVDVGRMSADLLIESGLESVMSRMEVIDYAFAAGRYPQYSFSFDRLSADEQVVVFDKLITQYPERMEGILNYNSFFTELGIEQFNALLGNGHLGNADLKPYRNLPVGSITHAKEAGLNASKICEALHNFDLEDRKAYYKDTIEGKNFDKYAIFAFPEQFDFIARDQFLKAARENNLLDTIASNIAKYTDGSDQSLILELIEDGNAEKIVDLVSELPNIDLDWLIEQVIKLDDLGALIHAMSLTDKIDPHEIFGRAIADPKYRDYMLKYELKYFSSLDKQTVLDVLLNEKLYEAITVNMKFFPEETEESVFEKISNDPEGLVAIANEIYKFKSVDRGWLAEKLAANENYEQVAKISAELLKSNIDASRIFKLVKDDPGAMKTLCGLYGEEFRAEFGDMRVFEQALQRCNPADIAYNLSNIKENLEIHQLFVDRCIELQDHFALRHSLDYLKIDRKSIIQQCCEKGFELPLIAWKDDPFFKDLPDDQMPSQEELLEWGGKAVILANPDRYPNADRNSLFNELIDSQSEALLALVINNTNTKHAPDAVAHYILGLGAGNILRRRKEIFNKSVFTAEFLEKYIEREDDGFIELYKYSGQKIDWIEKGVAIFGKDAVPPLLYAAREIDRVTDEPLPEHFAELGIKKRGQAGIEQLKRTFINIRNDLIYGTSSPEDLERFVGIATRNPIAKAVGKQLTRFTTSEWGKQTEDEWTRILTSHLAASTEAEPLGPEFFVSDEYMVRTIDAKEFDASNIDGETSAKFLQMQDSIILGLKIANMPGPRRMDLLFTEARSLIDGEITKLTINRDYLQEQGKQKPVEGLNIQIEKLQQFQDMTAKDFLKMTRDNFQQLTSMKIKGLDGIVRAGVFARAIRKSPEARNLAESLKRKKVKFKNLAVMDNLVDHVVNNEVYRDYFTDDASRNAFLKISDTSLLRNHMMKAQNGASSGATSLKFVPTRGPMLELSGHVGDACWASKYESIAKEFPNITAISFVRNPGKNSERLVGAGLMIETVDQNTGEEVIVLRGTNPIENYVNGVKVEDFFGALTDYAKKVAGGRRIATVIDDEPGRATTNRPVLCTYLKDVAKGNLTGVEPLKLPDNSTFNGYVLSAKKPYNHPVYYIN